MSILRSFVSLDFQALDEFGDPKNGWMNNIHIASAGWLGDDFLHISIEEEKHNDRKQAYEVEVNLTLEQAKIVLENIKKWVDFQIGKTNGI